MCETHLDRKAFLMVRGVQGRRGALSADRRSAIFIQQKSSLLHPNPRLVCEHGMGCEHEERI